MKHTEKNVNLTMVVSVLSLICSAVCVVLLLTNGSTAKTSSESDKSILILDYDLRSEKSVCIDDDGSLEIRDIRFRRPPARGRMKRGKSPTNTRWSATSTGQIRQPCIRPRMRLSRC